MNIMFQNVAEFNSDISKWDVSRVTNMNQMFYHATSFKQELCGAAWVNSKASKNDMFEGSSGSISRTECTSAPTPVTNQAPSPTVTNDQYLSRRPILERELIARKTISTPFVTSKIDGTITCPRCGTFRKSGRVSCCAPGGAWFKNCGGLGSKNTDHRWSDGLAACTRKFNIYDM